MFKDNKYTRCYNNIIDRAKSRVIDGYGENHHIIPRSLGGSDNQDNIVRLTAREHFICHLLLPKMTTDEMLYKMIYAYVIMSGRKIYGSRKYAFYREAYAIINSKQRSGKGNGMFGANRSGINNTFYGKQHTEETKRKISEKKKGHSYNKGIPKSLEHRKKMSEQRKGTGVVYSFTHPEFGTFTGNIQSLCDTYPGIFNKNYHKAELWKLATGIYKSCKGWKLSSV